MRFFVLGLMLAISGCMYPHPNFYKPDPDRMFKVLEYKARQDMNAAVAQSFLDEGEFEADVPAPRLRLAPEF